MTEMKGSHKAGRARISNLIFTVISGLESAGKKIPYDTLHRVIQMLPPHLCDKVKTEVTRHARDPVLSNIELPSDSCTEKPFVDFLRTTNNAKVKWSYNDDKFLRF